MDRITMRIHRTAGACVQASSTYPSQRTGYGCLHGTPKLDRRQKFTDTRILPGGVVVPRIVRQERVISGCGHRAGGDRGVMMGGGEALQRLQSSFAAGFRVAARWRSVLRPRVRADAGLSDAVQNIWCRRDRQPGFPKIIRASKCKS